MNHPEKVLLGNCSNDTYIYAPVHENQQSRHGGDIELSCQLGFLLNIHPPYYEFVRELSADFLEHRHNTLTRATGTGEKVCDNRLFGAGEQLFEFLA